MTKHNLLTTSTLPCFCLAALMFSTAAQATLMVGGLHFEKETDYFFDALPGAMTLGGPSGNRTSLAWQADIGTIFKPPFELLPGFTSGDLAVDASFSLSQQSSAGSFATYAVAGTVTVSDPATSTPWLFLSGAEGLMSWDEAAGIGALSMSLVSTATAPALLPGSALAHRAFNSNSIEGGYDFELNAVLTSASDGSPRGGTADATLRGRTIPEPMTSALLALGLGGIGWSLRRKTC